MVQGELEIGYRPVDGQIACRRLLARPGPDHVYPVGLHHDRPAHRRVGAAQRQGAARPLAGPVAGGDQGPEDLVDAVCGQVGRDRPAGAVGRLGVVAVHGELMGASPGHEPGGVVGGEPGPDLGRLRGGLELADKMAVELAQPREEGGTLGRIGVRGEGTPRTLTEHMGPEPAECPEVNDEVLDRPVLTGGNRGVGVRVGFEHGHHRRALGPHGVDQRVVVHRWTLFSRPRRRAADGR